jgi:methylphosphotriester-DNA--protein-cysteine methyltransferase
MPTPLFSTPSLRHQALLTRNPASSNAFIYSVLSTRIYCRPTCPSRLARRANIVFHDSAADAERDGFRACLRCRPDVPEQQDSQRKAIGKAMALIRDEVGGEKKWAVKGLAKEVGLTESHFCRVFKKVMGCTIGEYRANVLAERNGYPSTSSVGDFTPSNEIGGMQGDDVSARQDFERCYPSNEANGNDLGSESLAFSGALDSYLAMNGNAMDFDFSDFSTLTPDLISDVTSPESFDDGLQFLDFSSHNS